MLSFCWPLRVTAAYAFSSRIAGYADAKGAMNLVYRRDLMTMLNIARQLKVDFDSGCPALHVQVGCGTDQ